MQGRSNFSTDTRDTDHQWEVEQEKESDRPESHPHLMTEEKKKQHPDGEQSRCSPIAHRFTRVVRCKFTAALRDPKNLTENPPIVSPSHPQRDTPECDPCTGLLFEMIDIPPAERVDYNQLDATEKPEKPTRKRKIQRRKEHQTDAKRVEGDMDRSHRAPRL